MLVLTEEANRAVNAIVSQVQEGENPCVRISAPERAEGDSVSGDDLRLAVVPNPEPEDATVEGAPLYVEPDTAAFLNDKVLDAEVGEESVRFSFRERSSE